MPKAETDPTTPTALRSSRRALLAGGAAALLAGAVAATTGHAAPLAPGAADVVPVRPRRCTA
jgi:hypothetical protein